MIGKSGPGDLMMDDDMALPQADRAVAATPSSQQAVSPVPASIPSADVIAEIIGHLGAAVMQSVPSDDRIIMGHVRSALDMARLLRSARQ